MGKNQKFGPLQLQDIKSEKSYFSYIAIPVIYIIVQAMLSFEIINFFFTQILLLALINGIVAMSLNLINGMTGQFSFGQAGFMSVGAYVSAIMTKLVFRPAMTNYVSTYALFLVALIIGGLAAALIGFLIGVPSLRLRGDYLAIITLGFSEIIRVLWRVIPISGGARGFHSISRISNFAAIYIALIAIMFMLRNFTKSRYGRACIAIRENELAADIMGIDTTKAKILSFVFSAFIAGIGGGLLSHLLAYINPELFNQMKSTDMVLYVYTGGVGSYSSSLLGALIFTALPEFFRYLFGNQWRLVAYALVLILIMINRPKGIFGKYEFGFMRFGKAESVYQKAENAGWLVSAIQFLRQKYNGADASRKEG